MDLKKKLTLFHSATLILFLISCYINVHGKESTDIIVVDSEEDGEISTEVEEDYEVITDIFQPTNEWQVVKRGQAIPAGLHVRMDLSTGGREAKLLDEDETTQEEQSQDEKLDKSEAVKQADCEEGLEQEVSDTFKYWKEGEKEGIVHAKEKYFTHEELKKAMKHFRANKDDVEDEAAKKKLRESFRSIEDLKKDYEAMNLHVETDLEVMTKLIQTYNSTESTLEDKTLALRDLEYYVHQIDNAKDLATTGGLQLLIDALNSTQDEIKLEAAFVLGSAVQSNPHVQVKAIDGGALQSLLQLLSTSTSAPLRKKAMYAISSLLRMFPYAQLKFLDLGGLSTFSGLFRETDSSGVTLKVKAVTLLHDLLVEKSNTIEYDDEEDTVHQMRKQQYGRVDLLSRMLDQDWCHLVPTLLDVPDGDVQEKVLHAMEFLLEPCQRFSQDLTVVERLSTLKANLDHLVQEESGDADESYMYELSLLVNNILSHISS